MDVSSPNVSTLKVTLNLLCCKFPSLLTNGHLILVGIGVPYYWVLQWDSCCALFTKVLAVLAKIIRYEANLMSPCTSIWKWMDAKSFKGKRKIDFVIVSAYSTYVFVAMDEDKVVPSGWKIAIGCSMEYINQLVEKNGGIKNENKICYGHRLRVYKGQNETQPMFG